MRQETNKIHNRQMWLHSRGEGSICSFTACFSFLVHRQTYRLFLVRFVGVRLLHSHKSFLGLQPTTGLSHTTVMPVQCNAQQLSSTAAGQCRWGAETSAVTHNYVRNYMGFIHNQGTIKRISRRTTERLLEYLLKIQWEHFFKSHL
jgi:hypothetical protein